MIDKQKMQLIIFTLLILTLKPLLCRCQELKSDNESWLNRTEKIYQIKDISRLNSIINEVHSRFLKIEEKIRAFSILRLGTPYKLGCLGEEKPPDKGPLFRLDVADCTVFVITNVALAHKGSFQEARDMMRYLNYHNPPVKAGLDVISYANRYHFTEDRLIKCPYFRNITSEILPNARLENVDITLNRKSDGNKLLDIPWEKNMKISYFPSSLINKKLMEKIPYVCGVAFVKKKNFSIGLAVAHEGVIIERKYLIHADSVSGKVQKKQVLEYWNENSDYFDGMIISEFK